MPDQKPVHFIKGPDLENYTVMHCSHWVLSNVFLWHLLCGLKLNLTLCNNDINTNLDFELAEAIWQLTGLHNSNCKQKKPYVQCLCVLISE